MNTIEKLFLCIVFICVCNIKSLSQTKAVFLTKGMKPVEYVYYEADQSKIPLITVPGNTHDVVEKLEDLQQNIEFNHKEKLSKFKTLISRHVNVEELKLAL